MHHENSKIVNSDYLLSDVELKHLDYLSELINFGASKVQGIDIIPLNHLQSFLVFSHAAINNYSEAIYTLCINARPNAASVLLRSLYEADTTSEWIKLGDTDKKLALYARDGFNSRRKIANEFDAFIKKYSSKQDSLSILKEENIKGLREFTSNYIGGINSANKLTARDSYPDLLAKCRELDSAALDEEKGESELYYHLIYRYLSPFAHLNGWGLEMFVSKNPDQTYNFGIGQSKNVHLVIAQTYLFYFSSLQNLFDHNILSGVMPKKFEENREEIKNSDLSQ